MEATPAFGWDLMSSHGITLLFIARHPEATMAQVSRRTGLTERRIYQIIRDLQEARLFSVERHGRRNIYKLNPETHLHEPMLPQMTLGHFLRLFEGLGSPDQAS
jgi:DNA-binding MarR family transcriptional regulator